MQGKTIIVVKENKVERKLEGKKMRRKKN